MKSYIIFFTVLLSLVSVGQTYSSDITVNPKFTAIDSDGAPLASGCLYSYDCGTTDKAATCADYQCIGNNPNPITLDSRGEADVYIDGCYKLALYEADTDLTCDSTPSTALIWTKDNVRVSGVNNVIADDGTVVLNNGTDGTDASYTGDVISTSISLDGFDFTVGGWDVSIAEYESISKVLTAENTAPLDIAFNTDGTRMFMAGTIGNSIFQYNLTTAGDVDTAVYNSQSYDVTPQGSSPEAIAFSTDGTKMYVLGLSAGNDYVDQYSLSTPFAITTASYDSKNIDVRPEDTEAESIAFNSDGTKMYMVGFTNDTVFEYNISTPWDISTAVYSTNSFSVNSEEATPLGLFFSIDGTKMYIVGGADTVFQYELSTAWDITSTSYSSKSIDASSEDANQRKVKLSQDGAKMYLMGTSNDTVYQYATGFIKIQ